MDPSILVLHPLRERGLPLAPTEREAKIGSMKHQTSAGWTLNGLTVWGDQSLEFIEGLVFTVGHPGFAPAEKAQDRRTRTVLHLAQSFHVVRHIVLA